jgi:radical SAM-linked protein
VKLTEKNIRATVPRVVRIKFIKVGSLQYISHLDLQRTMARVLARTKIPVWYTEGFNPHIKLVFAVPLAVGVESICEFLDIRITGDISCEEIVERVNAGLTSELRVIEAYYPETRFSDIEAADYIYKIKTVGAGYELADRIKRFLTTPPVMVTRKTKSGERDVDIAQAISRLVVSYSKAEGGIEMTARLPAGSRLSINPALPLDALRSRGLALAGDITKESYSIMRVRLLFADGREFK